MASGLTYRGRLAVAGDPADIVVDLRIEGAWMKLSTAHQSLGAWDLADVSISRMADGRFGLVLGAEEACFQADDPLTFASEAIGAVRQIPARSRRKPTSPDTSPEPAGPSVSRGGGRHLRRAPDRQMTALPSTTDPNEVSTAR